MGRVTAMDRLRFEQIDITIDQPKSWPIYNGCRLRKGVSNDYILRNTAKIGGIDGLRETILTSDRRNFPPTSKAHSESLGGDSRSVSNGGNFSLVDRTGAKGVHTIDTPKSRHNALTLRQNSETLYCHFTKNNPNTYNHGKK